MVRMVVLVDGVLFYSGNYKFSGDSGNDFTLPRYFTMDYPEIIYVFDQATRRLKRNIGLIYYYWNYGGITFGTHKLAELIEYNIL